METMLLPIVPIMVPTRSEASISQSLDILIEGFIVIVIDIGQG